MAKIKQIKAREVLDSRGNPTVEVDLITDDPSIWGRAAVPSGASTGMREALELRDGDQARFLGKGVLKACENIQTKIAPKLNGLSVEDQKDIDQLMLELDGDEYKKNLGANAMLAVSLACARAGAQAQKKSLFRYLREDLGCPYFYQDYVFPNPLMNIINGGSHASNNLDIQEFMIVPHLKKSFKENLRAGVEVFHALKKVLETKNYSTNVGDEGGFAPNLESHQAACDLILKAIEKAGYRPGEEISLSFDAAASEFYENGQYHFQGEKFSARDMTDYYSGLLKKYPIYSLEDGLAESDEAGWLEHTQRLGNDVLLVGDDLFVTNKKIFADGIEKRLANSILVKLNQIGTLSETFETMALAKKAGYKAIVSHRSGETSDSFIADLSVATSCQHIKTGSASRTDRVEKYNQLLRLEEELKAEAKYLPVK